MPSFYTLLKRRYELELAARRRDAAAQEARGDEVAALKHVRRQLGRRLKTVGIGGALVPRATLVFLDDLLGIGGRGGGNCIVHEAYGTTETGGIAAQGGPGRGMKVNAGLEVWIDGAVGQALGPSLQYKGVLEYVSRYGTR